MGSAMMLVKIGMAALFMLLNTRLASPIEFWMARRRSSGSPISVASEANMTEKELPSTSASAARNETGVIAVSGWSGRASWSMR